jgi:hypothetical protein
VSTNVYHLQPQTVAAVADRREPVEAAVRDLSARIAESNESRRRLHSRLDELRSAEPASRPRALPVDPPRPVTFFSIEEAAPEPSARQVRRA